jgi:hypothetical protein
MNLHLTSPYTRGHDVDIAQRALNHSKLGDFYDGPIDGVYGEHTANATRKAREALGFSGAGISRHFDDRLLSYLQGDKPLPGAMQKRRKARKRKKPSGAVFAKALAIARKEVGTKEQPPNSNDVKYTRWYGLVGSPWCAMFVSWCFDKAGFSEWRYAYVPSILAAAHQGLHDMRVVGIEHARRCKTDLYLWNFPGEDHHPNHVSLGLGIEGQTARSLDGNTSGSGSQSNGGEVMVRTRPASLIEAVVHIDR